MKTTLALVLLALTSYTQAHAEDEINLDDATTLEVIADAAPQAYPEQAPCIQRGDCYLFDSTNHDYQAVDKTARIRLYGKGVQGKNTGQNMTLACVGPNQSCDVLRFIYYVNTEELYFVGPKFKVVNNDPKKLKKALKDLSKNSRATSLQTIGALSLAGGLAACFFLVPVVGTTPFLILFGGAFASWKALGSNRAGEPFAITSYIQATNGDDGVQLTNQNGWSWSSNARRINEKKFARMVQQLQVMNGFFYDNNGKNISVVR